MAHEISPKDFPLDLPIYRPFRSAPQVHHEKCSLRIWGDAKPKPWEMAIDGEIWWNPHWWWNWSQLECQMGMDQYLLIPFLGGWTSIYQLFWCSPGVQGFDTLSNITSIRMLGLTGFTTSHILVYIPNAHICGFVGTTKLRDRTQRYLEPPAVVTLC